MPLRLTDCWLPVTLLLLSVMTREAERDPVPPGSNDMLKVQLPPAASELPQVLVSGKSPGLLPITEKPEMFKVTYPMLLSVTV